MKQYKQLLRHVAMWTAVPTVTHLNSIQNLASGHKTEHLNIQLPHSTRGLGGIEMSKT